MEVPHQAHMEDVDRNDRQVTRDDDRVTPIGRLLRRSSLDELRQLINVLLGSMSLVGPPPHVLAVVVQQLQQSGRCEGSHPRLVRRPWGSCDSIASGPRFQVKRIVVAPGASLGLQKHHHRSEHWVVVSGTAQVTCGEHTWLLTENENAYIPLGQVHRLVNPGVLALEIIEVQSGSYLGEDDIVRLEDDYGRCEGVSPPAASLPT